MYNLSRICNLCMKDSNLLDTYSKNHNIDETILFVLPELIILQPESFLLICTKCQSTINDFYDFKKMCLKNNATLWSNVNTVQKLTNDQNLQSNTIEEEQQTEKDKISDPTTTCNETVTDSVNSDHSPLTFQQQDTYDDDSNLEEIMFDPSLDAIEETLNFVECASLSRDEDSSVQNVKNNLKTTSCDTNKKRKSAKNKKHTETKEFKCSVCNKIIKHKGHFNLHLKMHKDIKDFQCAICGKRFITNNNLKEHMMYVHSNTKNFECSVCSKKFIHRVSLGRHMKKHTGYDKEYECSVCNKKFTQKGSYVKHMEMHTGTKKFECIICNWKFLRKCHLTTHIKTHTGARDFECSVCNKKFVQNSYLKSHMKIHNGVKDFECSVCHKQFIRRTHLKSHMNRKHGVIKEVE